jgi:hypothetical protein
MTKKPVTVSSRPNVSVALGNTRNSLDTWRDRIRDPMLTVLLVLELSAMFIAAPLAAKGLPMARAVVETLVLAVLLIVVLLSQKWAAIILILLGLAATLASFPLSGDWSPVSATASPRRRDSRLLGADLGNSARGLCSRPDHRSPPSGCGRGLSQRGNNLRFRL